MKLRNHKYLFAITLLFFTLGFVNIHFALLGMVCMAIPIILLVKDKRKTWCQSYCPRARLYNKTGRLTKNISKKTPAFFVKGNMKWIVMSYFGLSMLLIFATTIAVAYGRMVPMFYLRFLVAIPIPGSMPQLFTIQTQPWIEHMAYRFYSMMMTTTFIGLILGLVYKPRTWCTICPIATVSDLALNKKAS